MIKTIQGVKYLTKRSLFWLQSSPSSQSVFNYLYSVCRYDCDHLFTSQKPDSERYVAF